MFSEFQVNVQIQFGIANSLKKQFPNDWEKIYNAASTDPHIASAIMVAMSYDNIKADPMKATKDLINNVQNFDQDAFNEFRKKSQ